LARQAPGVDLKLAAFAALTQEDALKRAIREFRDQDKRLLRACGRADRVTAYAYGTGAELWWKPIAAKLVRAKNLAVWRIPASASQALGKLAARSMQLQCTVQDGQLYFSSGAETVQIELEMMKAGAQNS